MKKILLNKNGLRAVGAVLFVLFLSSNVFAVTYYSTGSTSISTASNWNTARDGSGTAPGTILATSGDVFIIQGTGGGSGAPHAMTSSVAQNVSAGVTLEIENGASLTNTTTSVAQLIFNATAIFKLNANGTYIHNGSCPYSSILAGIEQFDVASNFEMQGGITGNLAPTTGPSTPSDGAGSPVLGFGNLTVTGLGGNTNSAGVLTRIRGNLLLNYSGANEVRLTGSLAMTLQIDGNLTITSGILNIGNGTANPIVNLLGDFSMAAGSLTFTGTATVSATTPMATINFAKSGVQTFTKTGGTIALSNTTRQLTFNVNSGSTLNFGTSILDQSPTTNRLVNFSVASGGTIKMGDLNGITSGTTASGAIQVTGTRTFSSGANYEYTGTGQVTGNGLPATINNLTISNAASVTLSAPNTVSGSLALTSGTLTLGANNLLVIGSATGGSLASHVVTDGAGILQNAIGAGATEVFPIGATTGSYSPVSITPTNGVTFGASVKIGFTNMVATPAKTLAREWNISATSAGSTVLSFTADASLNPPTGAADVIGHYNAGWSESDMTLVSRSGNTYTGTNVTGSFSPFGVGVAGGFAAVLSTELVSFKAKSSNNTNLLTWTTATEKNNMQFNIERSTNGSNFTSIGTVKGSGTRTTANNYTFTDETPLSISYYRLQSVDFDGKAQASNIVSVFRSTSGKLKVYPTVVSDKLTIVVDNNEAQTFGIYDLMGKTIQTGQLNGQKELSISTLATGTYVLKVGSEVVKFVKN